MANKTSSYIIDELYPLVESRLKNNSINKKVIANMAKFLNNKSTQINDIAPYTNIYYNKTDLDEFFKSIDLTEPEIQNILEKCFFWNLDWRPKCSKEPYVEVLICIIRYYLKNNKSKEAKLATVYTLFSGKFYASLYSGMWKFPVNPSIMDFVVNNMLSDKYDLKREGTILKAIEKLAETYLQKYKSELTKAKIDDDKMTKHLQQLRDREKSFLFNIYILYLDAAENKAYLNYETDSLDADSFRITDNDAAKAARYTESAVSVLSSQKVSMQYCNAAVAGSTRVKPTDIKYILEAIILSNNENLPKIKRVINIMICDFMGDPDYKNSPVGSANWFKYCSKPKPNTKNPLLIEQKNTILEWLNQDETYRRRSNTPVTANTYYRGIMLYFAQVVAKVAM